VLVLVVLVMVVPCYFVQLSIELTPSVSFEFGQENNNTMDTTSYGKLTVKLPLGNKQKFTNFAIPAIAMSSSTNRR
jgi:hypothetical protein